MGYLNDGRMIYIFNAIPVKKNSSLIVLELETDFTMYMEETKIPW